VRVEGAASAAGLSVECEGNWFQPVDGVSASELDLKLEFLTTAGAANKSPIGTRAAGALSKLVSQLQAYAKTQKHAAALAQKHAALPSALANKLTPEQQARLGESAKAGFGVAAKWENGALKELRVYTSMLTDKSFDLGVGSATGKYKVTRDRGILRN
jgi:hypothetical protein